MHEAILMAVTRASSPSHALPRWAARRHQTGPLIQRAIGQGHPITNDEVEHGLRERLAAQLCRRRRGQSLTQATVTAKPARPATPLTQASGVDKLSQPTHWEHNLIAVRS